MPKVTYLKEFEGALWARLELDMAPTDGPVQVFTQSEIKALRDKERQDCWNEIREATRSHEDGDF